MNEQKHAVLRDATQHGVLRDFGKHRRLVTDIFKWKHHIREVEAGLVRHRHARDKLAGCLDRYPFLLPESKLRLGKWEVENRVFLKELDETIAEDEETVNQWYVELGRCLCAYDGSPFKNWPEIAQLLGITRVRLGHFLKAHEDVIKHVSLHMCAALGAEVWDEEDAKIGILCWAVIRTDIKANSAVRYQVLKRLDSLFPGQIPPELLHPERNFEVIAGEPRDPS
jgi:hypothetical protein